VVVSLISFLLFSGKQKKKGSIFDLFSILFICCFVLTQMVPIGIVNRKLVLLVVVLTQMVPIGIVNRAFIIFTSQYY